MENKLLKNEEDVRGKVLLPFLNDLDFNLTDISLEDSFKVRLGKSLHKTGRSDILCKKYDRNLFVIEVKNDTVKIEQKDIDQGISYARLLDQIAPFTIVTNGHHHRIFDSVSKKELTGLSISKESSFFKNGYTLSSNEEIRIRIEALSKFVALSPENLKIFCKKQVNDRMGPIIGSPDSPHAKFVEELYVQNGGLKQSFDEFIKSENSVFGIVGDAGVGKTNALCSLSLQAIGDNFVFFYNATLLDKSPIELLAQDLNIAFSGKTEKETVLKKLNDLGNYSDKNILIFIDGIDECHYYKIIPELSEMALAVRNLNRIKFCFSNKTSYHKKLIEIKGTKTHLYEELLKTHGFIPNMDQCPGFLLTDFTEEEMSDIVPIYRRVYGFRGNISNALFKELQNGFFLRIFSEVYRNKQVPQKLYDKDLIKKYLHQSLKKTELGIDTGMRILSKVGEVFSNYKFTELEAFRDVGIDDESLYERLNFSVEQNLPKELFDRNLLVKSYTEEAYKISFYYSKIRDYIICYHSLKLNKLSDEKFYNILTHLFENRVKESALSFYCNSDISNKHKLVLIKFKRDKAINYVNLYEGYLNQNFKSLKKLFDPKTEGEIGIIMPKDLVTGDGYALYPFGPKYSEKILFEDLNNAFSGSYNDDPFIQKGVNTVYGSNTSFLVKNQDQTLKKNIFKQLKEILEKKKLNGYNSEILVQEKLVILLYHNLKKLNYEYELKDFYLPRFDFLYPVDLIDLEKRLYFIAATSYFQKEGKNRNEIDDLLKNSIDEIRKIPNLKYELNSQLRELLNLVHLLLAKGKVELKKHYLPTPDLSVEVSKSQYDVKKDRSYARMLQFSSAEAKTYTKRFFELLEICYKEFIDYYFPTLKSEFSFYSKMPNEYFVFTRNNEIRDWGFLAYKNSHNKRLAVNFKNWDTSTKKLPSENDISNYRTFSFDQLLYIKDSFMSIRAATSIGSSDKIESYCILKYWIYKMISKDFKNLLIKHTGSEH